MDVGADELLVTTGGQQVIDLVCKTLIDPGDVIVAEGPTYPGAVPTFGAYEADVVQIEMDADGMRIDLLEETLDRLEREGRTPKFIYTVPTFQNPAGVTMSLERRRRLVQLAAERELLVLEDNPYGLLRYEGEPLPPLYALDGGEYVIYLGTFSKILSAGPAPRLDGGAAAGAREAQPRQAGRRPLLVDVRAVLRHRVLRAARLARPARRAARALPRGGATRCSTRSPSTSRPRPTGPAPAAACSSGRRCPTTSTRRTCWRARCASTSRSSPGAPRSSTAAADRRCGSTSPASARTTCARACAGSARSSASRSASTRRSPAPSPRPRRRRGRAGRPAGADRATRPTRAARGRAAATAGRRRAMSRVAVLAGGQSLERQVSLRSGARVRDALERLGHDVIAIDVGPDLVERLDDDAARRRVRRAARPRRRGRHGPGDPRARRRALHGVGPVGLHALHGQGARQARAPRRRAADAGLLRVQPDRVRVARRRARAAGDRGAARLPGRRQARRAGLGARDPLRADRRRRARGDRRRVLLRHEGAARAPRRRARARGLGARRARRPRGAADRRGDPARRRPLRLRGALRDRAHRLRLPGRARRRRRRSARRRSRSTPTACSAATASPAST